MKTAIALSYLVFVLTVCNPATPTPAATAVLSPVPVRQSSATFTKDPREATVQRPRPTSTPKPTPIPTETSTATSTPWPVPTEKVLIQYGMFGGDGGDYTSFYLGRDVPQLILYTNGQLLTQQKSGNWFAEAHLSNSQICTLLSRIKRTGFFETAGDGRQDVKDPIYSFGNNIFYSDGLSDYVIQVNGEPHKTVYIYPDYEPYLIRPISATLQFLRKYSSPVQTLAYRPKYIVLWVEKGLGNPAYRDQLPTPQPWPSQLLSLAALLSERKDGQFVIEGENVTPILTLFGNRPRDIVFEEDSQTYYLIARPLLPHETPDKFSRYPHQDIEFDLPFTCP